MSKVKFNHVKLRPGKWSHTSKMWHIFVSGVRAGRVEIKTVRKESSNALRHEIDIHINQKIRGQGIGSIAYKKAVEASGYDAVYAIMRKGNTASRRAAEKAGFQIVDDPASKQLVMIWRKNGRMKNIKAEYQRAIDAFKQKKTSSFNGSPFFLDHTTTPYTAYQMLNGVVETVAGKSQVILQNWQTVMRNLEVATRLQDDLDWTTFTNTAISLSVFLEQYEQDIGTEKLANIDNDLYEIYQLWPEEHSLIRLSRIATNINPETGTPEMLTRRFNVEGQEYELPQSGWALSKVSNGKKIPVLSELFVRFPDTREPAYPDTDYNADGYNLPGRDRAGKILVILEAIRRRVADVEEEVVGRAEVYEQIIDMRRDIQLITELIDPRKLEDRAELPDINVLKRIVSRLQALVNNRYFPTGLKGDLNEIIDALTDTDIVQEALKGREWEPNFIDKVLNRKEDYDKQKAQVLRALKKVERSYDRIWNAVHVGRELVDRVKSYKSESAIADKTITSGSDASAGMLVCPDDGTAKGHGLTSDDAKDIIGEVVDRVLDAVEDEDEDADEYYDEKRRASKPRPVPQQRRVIYEESDNPQPHAPMYTSGNPLETHPKIPASYLVDRPTQEAVFEDGVLPSGMDNMFDGFSKRGYRTAVEPVNVPKSVPNYHRPDDTPQICATCVFYKEKNGEVGHCSAFDFTAIHDYTCDAWKVKTVETNGVDSERNPELNEAGDVIGDGLKSVPNTAKKPDVPEKYSHIDFTITKAIAENARLALETRMGKPKSERGMTPVGIRRATQLANRQAVSPETWRRMLNYFTRHEVDKKGKTWDERGKGWQAWMGWGGDEAYDKAKDIVEKMNEADNEQAAKSLGVTVGTVKEWANQDCPSDIRNCDLYKKVRARIRRDVTERGSNWGAYDSLRLRKEYKNELEARRSIAYSKAAIDTPNYDFEDEDEVVSDGIMADIVKTVENEVLEQGGVIGRAKTARGISGYDEVLGKYTAKDLSEWLDEEWVDIAITNDDGSHPECGHRQGEGAIAKCLPRSKAEKLTKDEKERLINRKRRNPDDYVSNDTDDLRKKGSDKSDGGVKLVDCSKIPPERRHLYPECGEDADYYRQRPYYGYSYDVLSHGSRDPEDQPDDTPPHDDNTDDMNGDNESMPSDTSGNDSGASDNSGGNGDTGGAGASAPAASAAPASEAGAGGGGASGSGAAGGGGGSGAGGGGATATDEVKPSQKSVGVSGIQRRIRRASGPTADYRGGEAIDERGEVQASPESYSGSKIRDYAHEEMPSLSNNYGRQGVFSTFYLPNERIYSKSMRSLGRIVKSQVINGNIVYNIELVDKSDVVHGHAVVHESDLQPRSMRAIKRVNATADRAGVEGLVEDVIQATKGVILLYEKDGTAIAPEDCDYLEKIIKDALSSAIFEVASSQMKLRKYVRAMQEAQHAIGATAHILRIAEDVARFEDSASSKTASDHAQSNAHNRLSEVVSRLEESKYEDTPMRSY